MVLRTAIAGRTNAIGTIKRNEIISLNNFLSYKMFSAIKTVSMSNIGKKCN